MKRIKSAVGVLFLLLIIAILVYAHHAYRVPVLMYHSINSGAEKSRLVVSPETFERQMSFLAERGYRVLSLQEYVDILKHEKKQPRRSVVITFDDGFRDNYEKMFPVLKKHSFPASVFVVVDWVGKEDMMNWEQLRELARSGLVEIGSHGMKHCVLTDLNPEDLRDEILRSKIELESKLGSRVRYLCYPCGFFNRAIKTSAIEAGYEAALATHPGSEVDLKDIYAIRRIRVSESSANLFVFWAQTSGYYNFLKDRRVKYKNLD